MTNASLLAFVNNRNYKHWSIYYWNWSLACGAMLENWVRVPIVKRASQCKKLILLKQCSKSLAHPLQQLYKASLKTGEIPTNLKRAIITPMYKEKYPPLPRNASENESQATRLPLWQILPLPATGASQQDIRGIGKVKQC